MIYLDSTYQKVCTVLLNIARLGGIEHSGDSYLEKADKAYKLLKETNPSVEQLREIALSIGYNDESYSSLIEGCRNN